MITTKIIQPRAQPHPIPLPKFRRRLGVIIVAPGLVPAREQEKE